jgi:formylglycine-generating enzyme required for sulfatase activity
MNADLATLTMSSGTLTPAFSAGTTSYAVTVMLDVTTLTVTATAADPYATLSIVPTQPMPLVLGANPVTVTVTAESGAQKAYSVVVTRLSTNDYTSPSIGTLKYVPAGTFQRDATPTNLSNVSAFRMSRYEITRAQWTAVTGWADPSNVTVSSGSGDPVQMVSRYDAIAFCNKLSLLEGLTPVYAVSGVNFSTLTYAQIPAASDAAWNAATANWAANGYRLPTEMEWMWAAMGADNAAPGVTNTTGYLKTFAGSTGSNAIGDYAWYGANSMSSTHQAGTKMPNELGLYDLSGNVWELDWDWYVASYPTGPVTDYRGPAIDTTFVLRGGSWGDLASVCTVAVRNSYCPHCRDMYFGFRVVRP